MVSSMSIESILARYLRACINAIQEKPCEFCGKGHWFVIIILAVPVEGHETDFSVKCGVQCHMCKSLENREWRYNPYLKPAIVETKEQL